MIVFGTKYVEQSREAAVSSDIANVADADLVGVSWVGFVQWIAKSKSIHLFHIDFRVLSTHGRRGKNW